VRLKESLGNVPDSKDVDREAFEKMCRFFGIFVLVVLMAGATEAQTVPRVPIVVTPPISTAGGSAAGPIRVEVPRVQVAPLVPPSYYAGYPYGYVPYNQRFLYSSHVPSVNPGNSVPVPTSQVPNPLRLGSNNPAPRFGPSSNERFNFQYDNNVVRSLQSELRRRGYYTGAVDGIFGPATQTALEQFQIDRKQSPSGQIDQTTLSVLGIIR
jgi:Putative peptidoglycan binding domain